MNLKRRGLVLGLVAVLTLAISGCGGKLAATVNGRKVYLKEVEEQLKRLKTQHGQSFKGAKGQALEKQFKESILSNLIEIELVLNYAEKQKITVSEKEVEDTVKQIKAGFPSTKAFKERLEKENLSEKELKERIKENLIVNKIMEKTYKGIDVDKKEAQEYYEANKDQFQEPEQVKLRQIILNNKTEAEEVLKSLKAGADFTEVAKKESEDPTTKAQGGDLGWQSREGLKPGLADKVFALNPGALSEIISVDNQFYIVKAEEKKSARQKSYEESKDEAKQRVLEQKRKEKYQTFINNLKQKAKIKKFI